jgi:hypothetical protein
MTGETIYTTADGRTWTTEPQWGAVSSTQATTVADPARGYLRNGKVCPSPGAHDDRDES